MQGALRPWGRRPRLTLSRELVTAGAFAAAATSALVFTIALGQRSSTLAIAGGLVMAAAIWLISSERYTLTLGLLMIYIGCFDGVLKLRYNSEAFVLVRDVLLYAVVAGALIRWSGRRSNVHLPPLTGWVAAWVVIVIVEVLNPANGTLLHSVQALRQHLEFVPLFFFGFFVMRTSGRLRGFLFLLVVVAAVNGIANVIQFNLTPQQLASWGQGYADRINGVGVGARGFLDDSNILRTRPFGLGSDIGFGGVTCLLAAPAAMALLYRRNATSPLLAIPLIVAVAIGIATSQARLAVVGSILAVAAFLLMTLSPRRWFGTLAATAVTATVVFLVASSLADNANNNFDRYDSIAPGEVVRTTYDYRKDTILSVGTYAADFPLGAGLGTVGPAGSTAGGNGRVLNAESEYTFLLVETGVPGLITLVGFNLLLLSMVVRRIHTVSDRDTRVLLAAIAAPLFALVIAWIVGPSSASTPASPYTWFASGVLVYWLHEGAEQARAAPA